MPDDYVRRQGMLLIGFMWSDYEIECDSLNFLQKCDRKSVKLSRVFFF